MKRITKSLIAIVLCLMMLVSTASISFAAAAVGTAKNLKVASTTQTVVNLKWSKVSKATGYKIESYNSSKKAWVTEGYTKELTFADRELQPGKVYKYRVKAYISASGKKTYGSASNTVSALTKPNKINGVVATDITGTSVTLKWDKADGASSYIVYKKNPKTEKYEKLATTTSCKYKATFKCAQGTVYFKVKSCATGSNLTEYSDLSAQVKASIKPATVNTLTASNQKEASCTLKWNKCEGATGYIVYKKDVTTNWESYVELGKTSKTSYNVTYPCSPVKCYFKVTPYAENAGTTIMGQRSACVRVDMKPEKVKNLKVSASTMQTITLNWTRTEGPSNYEIYQLKNKKYELIDIVENPPYTIGHLDYATEYKFKIKAVSNYEGNVYRTGYSEVVTGRTKFGDVKGIKITVDTDNKAYIMWDETHDADGYCVEKNVNGVWQQIVDTKAALCTVSEFEPEKKLQPGNKYTYRIRAYMKSGEAYEYSKYTDEIQIKAVPEAPGEINAATGSDHSIVLQWERVAGAEGYDIYYLDDTNGVWRFYHETAGVEYTSISNKNYVYFTDKGLEESGIYQYKIRAFVMNNGTKSVGEFSEVVAHPYTYSSDREQLFEGGLNSSGAIGYLYDEKYDCFYTANDPWQRNFGFNLVYDVSAQWVLIQYDTVRFKFKYQGKDWMIQPWKGQYGWILFGGEVGVYVKYTDRGIEHYDCAKDEDRLMMSMDLYRYWDDTKQWELQFKRPYSSYWWCTGFKPGFIKYGIPGTTSYQNELRIDLRITMKDFEMLEAFTQSLETLEDNKYAPYKNITGVSTDTTDGKSYWVKGLDVYLSFK